MGVAAYALAEGREGARAYLRYLEERAKDRKGVMNEEANRALRRGWYLGDKSFGEQLLATLSGKEKKVGMRRRAESVSR